ncbi:hypothetical protein Pst134EB_004472 [Puccinia striiformis f. sp. tritici]|nr:hypothetical protein Pst134EB_004472 [Puccinia striiformis f. sp. tritici]
MSTTSGSFPSPNPQHAQPPAQDRAQRDGANGPSSFQGLAGTGAHCGVNLRAVEYEKPLPAPPPSWPCDRSTDVVDGAVPDAEWKTTKPLFYRSPAAASERMCPSVSNYSQPSNSDNFSQPSRQLSPIRQSLSEPESDWIPANKVFSPGAAPLLLPALEKLIQRNPKIRFSDYSPQDLSPQELEAWRKFTQSQRPTSHRSPRRGWFGLEWWRKLQSQRGSIIEDNHDSAFDEKEAALLKATPTDEALSRTNGIMLPMHLLDSKILKPLSSSGSSDNPALSFLNLIPNFGSSSSENPPAQPGRSLSLSNTFLILAHLENFRDFLQFIGLIGGFYGSTLDSGHTNISKLPIFQRVFMQISPNDQPYRSFRNYSLLLFQWLPGLFSFDLTIFLGYSSPFILIYPGLVCLMLCEFYRLTGGWNALGKRRSTQEKGQRNHHIPKKECEGHELPESQAADSAATSSSFKHYFGWKKIEHFRNTNFYSIAITLILLSLYVPITRISIEALVWGNNFWPIDNYYVKNQDQEVNLTDKLLHEVPGSLITPIEFCYRTTIKKHGLEVRGLVLFQSIFLLLAFSCWFPFRFFKTIISSSYIRNQNEQHPHDSDDHRSHQTPGPDSSVSEKFSYFCHSYKQGDRRDPVREMTNRFLIKLIVILLATIPVKDNCVFIKKISRSRYLIDLMRCLFLSFTFLLVWIFHSVWKPHRFKSLNRINDLNIKFCLFLSVVGLGSVFIHFQERLFGSIVLIWTTILYLLNIHYITIQFKSTQRLFSNFSQKLQIDENLFSADFDFSKEVVRRVWHESLITLLLGMPDYRVPEGKTLLWREEVPGAPYLVNYDGTHGERLVENFRLLEAFGAKKYRQASQHALRKNPSDEKDHSIERIIRNNFTGPDCFWKPHDAADLEGVSTFFGRADVIPFPFMVIFKYDQRLTPVCLSRAGDLRAFVAQNQNPQVMMRRKVRLVLRALEGKELFAPISLPWEAVHVAEGRRPRWFQRARPDVTFRSGVLKIQRNCHNKWQGYNLNSGFQVSIEYKDGHSLKSDGSAISQIPYSRLPKSLGLRDDFKLTPTLAKLFEDNHSIISTTMEKVEQALESHRSYYSRHATWKQNTMSFSFLEVFFQNQHSVPGDSLISKLESHLRFNEVDQQLRRLPQICRGSLRVMEERMERINESKLNQWWFVVFDDIYRRNSKILNRFSNKPEDFSPHYRGSVCYRPMVRSELERFLIERNVFQPDLKSQFSDPARINQQPNHSIFTSGFLNLIYFHLDLFLFKEEDESPQDERKARNFQPQDNCLPRSELYQGVYETGQPHHHGHHFLERLKRRLKQWLLVEEPFGAAEETNHEDSEAEDLEASERRIRPNQRREQLIKLGPRQNFSKVDWLPTQTYKIASNESNDSHARQDTTTAGKQTPANKYTNSNSDRSTYLHCSGADPSHCNTSSYDSHTGYDITDDPDFNSQVLTEETDSTLYGFY